MLEVGHGTGDLLLALGVARGVGCEFSPAMAEAAAQRVPGFRFCALEDEEVPLDETFDAIVVSGVIRDLTDVEAFFVSLRRLATPRTRLFRRDYELMERQREVLARADPFGDFFLLFGAAKQMLRIIEVPIRYRSRRYGDTKTRLVRHGLLLPRTWWAGVRLFKLAS